MLAPQRGNTPTLGDGHELLLQGPLDRESFCTSEEGLPMEGHWSLCLVACHVVGPVVRVRSF